MTDRRLQGVAPRCRASRPAWPTTRSTRWRSTPAAGCGSAPRSGLDSLAPGAERLRAPRAGRRRRQAQYGARAAGRRQPDPVDRQPGRPGKLEAGGRPGRPAPARARPTASRTATSPCCSRMATPPSGPAATTTACIAGCRRRAASPTSATSRPTTTAWPTTSVSSLFRDRVGTFWVGTWYAGVSRVDLGSGGFARIVKLADGPATLSDNKVRAIVDDGAGKLWLGTNDGLNRLDPATGAGQRVPPPAGQPEQPVRQPGQRARARPPRRGVGRRALRRHQLRSGQRALHAPVAGQRRSGQRHHARHAGRPRRHAVDRLARRPAPARPGHRAR